MLDIPESVKNLFDQDSVRKNFRAVFDSGLVVTNSDITWNSLRFRESVCSADSVTFGAAEASVLNFETRGVRNMLGEWFDAWMEVDATTLPAELQTEREDLDYPVYPVPLGRFVVTACPRNHEAMTKRKVTAMSNLDADEATTYGIVNQILPRPIVASIKGSMAINTSLSGMLRAVGFLPQPDRQTETANQSSQTWTASTRVSPSIVDESGTSVYLWIAGSSALTQVNCYLVESSIQLTSLELANFPKNAEYACQFPGVPDDVNIPRIVSGLAAALWGLYSGNGFRIGSTNPHMVTGPDDPALIDFLGSWLLGSNYFVPKINTSGVVAELTNNGSVYYPLPTLDRPASGNILVTRWSCAYAISAQSSTSGLIYAVTSAFRIAHPTLITRVVYYSGNADVLDQTMIRWNPEIEDYRGSYKQYKFTAPPIETVNAIIELQGAFGCFSRATGQKYLKRLDQDPVMQISRGQLSSAWWDEFDLAPVGSIAYRLGGEDYVYVFGDGQSQYVFQNSDIFDMIQNCTTDMVQAMMDEHLVPALQNLTFTPAEIDSLGFPYLEAGDCIELEAEDGSIIKTYVLEREMHGTQHLTDRVTADGITITEVDL